MKLREQKKDSEITGLENTLKFFPENTFNFKNERKLIGFLIFVLNPQPLSRMSHNIHNPKNRAAFIIIMRCDGG